MNITPIITPEPDGWFRVQIPECSVEWRTRGTLDQIKALAARVAARVVYDRHAYRGVTINPSAASARMRWRREESEALFGELEPREACPE